MTFPALSANTPSGYFLSKSVRIRKSATAYFSRTPSVASNRKTYTWSGWVKRGQLGINCGLFEAENAGKTTYIGFGSNDQLLVQFYDSTYNTVWNTTAVYRDPSAWYHIVWVVDTTQASPSNMVKIWVNGVQLSLTLTHYAATIPQNYDTWINSTNSHRLGTYAGLQNYYDGYYAEVNFIDGQALTPSSFGSTNTLTGVWQPIQYSGTYGTNGYYLKFTDVATTSGSNAGLGKDFSGNGNYYATNNISVTAGSTYDSMTDVPTLTSATVANYAVLNPISKTTIGTPSNANLTMPSSAGPQWISTIGVSSGKYYAEFIWTTINTQAEVTVIDANGNFAVGYRNDGTKDLNGSSNNSAYGATYTTGDVIGVALDVTNKSVTFYKNNVSQGAVTYSGSNLTGEVFFGGTARGGSTVAINCFFGQQGFNYTPPTGYVALNTYNLPDSTIVKGNKYMDATTYTGDGTTPKSQVNTSGFQPDFVWIKDRNNTNNYFHQLYDSVRGAGATHNLVSNSTSAENDGNAQLFGYLSAFNSNGFQTTNGTSGALPSAYVNQSSDLYVAWQWQAGQGTTSNNTSGSITSTVSANTSAGFSIVTYTGTGATATVGHGLGVAPQFIIFKRRNGVADWPVYHASIGATKQIWLSLTNAANTNSGQFANTEPTSSVFTIGTNGDINTSTGTYVAYCWAEIAGFSKFGSYTGNGSTSGPFVYTGFRPKFVMTKRTDSISSWCMTDSVRGSYNVDTASLYANLASQEDTTVQLDLLSNGFKLRDSDVTNNANGGTYIYMAFAENPFKNALAR